MDTGRIIDDVLKGRTWLSRDNSNTQVSPSLVDYVVFSKAVEEYALKKLYTADVARQHKEGSIYIHTLHSAFRPYCDGVDPRVFLLDGLRFPQCRSNPAKHFVSAVYQSMAYMFYSQLFFAGAQAMDYYNWFLAPYAHFDGLEYREIKQAVQGLVYQLNQSNRTGAQSAFSNIGLRIRCPSYLKEQRSEAVPVVYCGSKMRDVSYADFEREARMIYRAFMEVMREGDGNGLPFTFPIITTAITKGLDWDDPLVLETMKTAAEKGTPYFFNLTADYLDEKYVHAMCCRLLTSHSGGIWQAGGIGTGSNKVVTLNLPHIALLAKKDEGKFFELLDDKLEAARKALMESNAIIRRSLYDWKLLPLLTMKTKDGTPYYNFRERKLTLGMIGMNECLLNLIGDGLVSDSGMKLGKRIVARMAERAAEFSKKDGVTYTLEQTPAEAASYKLASMDKKRFGRRAHVQGSGSKLYYTNSTHVPYSTDIPLFEKVEKEAGFHPFFNGGTICHVWIGESRPDPGAMKSLVRKMAGTKLAYFTFSPDFSVCKNNHVRRGKVDICPACGARMDHMNRVVGYFTRTSRWNPGKQQEYRDRVRYRL